MDEIIILIENELGLIENKISDLITEDDLISLEIRNFITTSSKRIRSIFAILYLKANNKILSDKIINIITAGEIIHNASLLHDDVIDSTKLRRGIETLETKFSTDIAILAGDLLLSAAVKLLLETNNNKILDIFLNCTKRMCNSEIKQYILKGKKPTKEEYINICEGKTASLFEAIIKSISIITDLDINKGDAIAKKFGILFQINNDLDPTSAKQDEINKIYTAKSIYGVEKTNILTDNYKKEIRDIVREFKNKQYSDALVNLVENYDRQRKS